jgi:hypothetical protein
MVDGPIMCGLAGRVGGEPIHMHHGLKRRKPALPCRSIKFAAVDCQCDAHAIAQDGEGSGWILHLLGDFGRADFGPAIEIAAVQAFLTACESGGF